MRYGWLLFDADGTLFDYDRAEAIALARSFAEIDCRFEPEYVQVYRQINGSMWQEFEQGKLSQKRLRIKRFEALFEAIGVEADPVRFSPRYLAHLAAGTNLVDGAEQVLESLHGRVGLLLITNGFCEVQRPRFATSTIGHYFSAVVISEEVGAAKPERQIFDAAFQRMGHPPKREVLIVGDSLTTDIKGGNNYGIDACWFNPDHKPLTGDVEIQYEIRELTELLSIVETS
jgi:2-haloacid dehalogenase